MAPSTWSRPRGAASARRSVCITGGACASREVRPCRATGPCCLCSSSKLRAFLSFELGFGPCHAPRWWQFLGLSLKWPHKELPGWAVPKMWHWGCSRGASSWFRRVKGKTFLCFLKKISLLKEALEVFHSQESLLILVEFICSKALTLFELCSGFPSEHLSGFWSLSG